jgi:hypothetical protein
MSERIGPSRIEQVGEDLVLAHTQLPLIDLDLREDAWLEPHLRHLHRVGCVIQRTVAE